MVEESKAVARALSKEGVEPLDIHHARDAQKVIGRQRYNFVPSAKAKEIGKKADKLDKGAIEEMLEKLKKLQGVS